MKTHGQYITLNSKSSPVPDLVHLVPEGRFSGRDGRGPWIVADAKAFISATMARHAGADIVIDYEHQSEYSEKNGQPAPAAGWIKGLLSLPDGIWGRVEWTPRAAEMIAGQEYRYISPVFVHDEANKITRLESAALVARPNLELKALNKEGADMEEFLRQLAVLLGLAETASQEEIFAAVQKLAEQGESANSDDGEKEEENSEGADDTPETLPEAEAKLMDAVADLMDLAEEEAAAEPAANRQKQSPERAAMHSMGKRLARLEGQIALNRAEKMVARAMTDGKITPGLKTWALDYAARDPKGFAGFAAGAPVVVGSGRAVNAAVPGGRGLNAEEKAVCKQLVSNCKNYEHYF